MVVRVVGLQKCCGEAATEFVLPMRQETAQGLRSKLRNQAARGEWLMPRLTLGELREKDFYLSSSAVGLRCYGSCRRAFGYPGPGKATARTDDEAYRRS